MEKMIVYLYLLYVSTQFNPFSIRILRCCIY